jgi:chromosome segregation and condensation protein ScpB
MRKSNHVAIRALLHQNPDGLMVSEIAKVLGVEHRSIKVALQNMVDTYIDRWVKLRSAPMAAVWCAIEVPPNCPKPDDPRSKSKKAN